MNKPNIGKNKSKGRTKDWKNKSKGRTKDWNTTKEMIKLRMGKTTY